MSHTRVVNVRLVPYDVYVGRAGRGKPGTFGNPYLISPAQPRSACIDKFRQYFSFKMKEDAAFAAAVTKLVEIKRTKGELTLGCFCATSEEVLTAANVPFTCHGQVIAEFIDARCP